MKPNYYSKRKKQYSIVGQTGDDQFRLEKIGCLKVGEQQALQEWSENQPNHLALASQVALQINEEFSLNDEEFAFQIVVNPNWGQRAREKLAESDLSEGALAKALEEIEAKDAIARKCRIKFAKEITSISKSLAKANQQEQLIVVTSLLRSRIEPDEKQNNIVSPFKKEELINVCIETVQTCLSDAKVNSNIVNSLSEVLTQKLSMILNLWTEGDTFSLSSFLFDACVEFAQSEIRGDKPLPTDENISAEELGKPLGANSPSD